MSSFYSKEGTQEQLSLCFNTIFQDQENKYRWPLKNGESIAKGTDILSKN